MAAESFWRVGLRSCVETDRGLQVAIALLLALGLIMVASSSIAVGERLGAPLLFFQKQLLFCLVALTLAMLVLQIPLLVWSRFSVVLLLLSLLFLGLLLIPGVGREVNGSVRWLSVAGINWQPSEVLKLTMIIYLAGYLERHGARLQDGVRGLLAPLLILAAAALLLLFQPDFGALVLVTAIAFGLLFLAGAPLLPFIVMCLLGLVAGWRLIVESPYRLDRLTVFRDPWSDPFDSGFQLTQSLIAIGRGEWWGVGLGGSVQKLSYLPEPHTDFVFAVLAEELGLIGVVLLVALYAYLCLRVFRLGSLSLKVNRVFAGFLCYGVAVWLGLQSFINMAVTMGLLPTKGLTLPLLSYGGSSLLVTVVALALVLRADYERRQVGVAVSRVASRRRAVDG